MNPESLSVPPPGSSCSWCDRPATLMHPHWPDTPACGFHEDECTPPPGAQRWPAEPRTKKIRIAVAMTSAGAWNAVSWGGDGSTSQESDWRDTAFEGLDAPGLEGFCWVEADILLPDNEVRVVQGVARSELPQPHPYDEGYDVPLDDDVRRGLRQNPYQDSEPDGIHWVEGYVDRGTGHSRRTPLTEAEAEAETSDPKGVAGELESEGEGRNG